jgi:hypothetical protein
VQPTSRHGVVLAYALQCARGWRSRTMPPPSPPYFSHSRR